MNFNCGIEDGRWSNCPINLSTLYAPGFALAVQR
jgi:hypothetical protein